MQKNSKKISKQTQNKPQKLKNSKSKLRIWGSAFFVMDQHKWRRKRKVGAQETRERKESSKADHHRLEKNRDGLVLFGPFEGLFSILKREKRVSEMEINRINTLYDQLIKKLQVGLQQIPR